MKEFILHFYICNVIYKKLQNKWRNLIVACELVNSASWQYVLKNALFIKQKRPFLNV